MPTLTEAATQLEPLRQGACDYLCGVYSIINAIRLASYPEKLNGHALYHEAIAYLIAKDRLAEVMQHGMGTALWRKLLKTLIASRQLKVPLKIIPYFPYSPTFEALNALLARGHPVLMELSGHCYHSTVATEIKHNRIYLFDSDGMRWINVTSVSRVETRTLQARYQIVRGSVVSLEKRQ